MSCSRSCQTLAMLAFASCTAFAADADSLADNLAVWRFGAGTIASKPAVIGADIAADAAVVSSDELVRVTFVKAPKCHLTLSPHSRMHLTETDGGHLLVYLEQGVLQANIGDKGPYADVHVLGAAIDVRVTGTLFVVERVKADTDYVALVEGRVQVNTRKDVVLALKEQGHAIDLTARQGLGGSLSAGLGAVDTLTGRPQLPSSTAASGSVQEIGTTMQGGWDEDLAMSLTSGQELADLTHSITDEVRSQIADQISHQVTSDVTQQVTDTIVQQIIGGGAQSLTGPPNHP